MIEAPAGFMLNKISSRAMCSLIKSLAAFCCSITYLALTLKAPIVQSKLV
jgi:hypothetical protein